MTLLMELGLGDESCKTLSMEYLFDTPLAPALMGISKVVDADNVLDLEERRAWLKMKKKGEDMSLADCERLLQLENEEVPSDNYDDEIAFLEERIRQEEERRRLLDERMEQLDSDLTLLEEEEEEEEEDDDYKSKLTRSENDERDLKEVSDAYSRISTFAGSLEDTVSESTALPLVESQRYADAEDEYGLELTSLTKHLLSSRMSLLNSVFKPSTDESKKRSPDEVQLKERYRCSSSRLIQAKLSLEIHKVAIFPEDKVVSIFSSLIHEARALMEKLGAALDSASEGFVSSQDGSDLDLQSARLIYFVDTKRRILDRLMEQCCRQLVFLDLRYADELLHDDLAKFLQQSKDFLQNLASEKARMQRSLDGVSAFANAPCSSQSSPAVHDAVEAVKNIILPELPPLVPVATPKEPTVPINDETDEEVLQMLMTEWRKRLTKNEADSKAWEENLRSVGTRLLRISDTVVEESRSLQDREAAVQLHRLQGKYKMATKSVLHAVDVEARAARRDAKS